MTLTKLGLIDEEIVIRAREALDASMKEKAAIEAKGNKKKKGGDEDARMEMYSLIEEYEKDQEDPDSLDSDAEPYNEEENLLREKIAILKKENAQADKEDEDAATALIDARVALMGPMATNPFPNSETSTNNTGFIPRSGSEKREDENGEHWK